MLIEAKSDSSKAKWLIYHVVGLELTNTIGFLCAAVTFGTYINTGEELYDQLKPLWDNWATINDCGDLDFFRDSVARFITWTAKINTLNIVSNASFLCTGILTDAMLVSISSYPEVLRWADWNGPYYTDMAV